MRYTNPFDRLAYALRPAVYAMIWLCVPVALMGYGWMLRELFLAAPWWVSVVVGISHLVSVLGLAIQIDSLREQLRLQGHDQS